MSALDLVPAPRTAPDRCADDDRGLLDDLAAGDDAAWQATVRRYEGLLRSAARVVLRSDADVDEAVQRTWVLLFRNADADQRRRAACRAGCRRPPAARRWPSCAVSSAPIPSEDVADHVAPDDTDVADGAHGRRAAPGAATGRWRPCRPPSG